MNHTPDTKNEAVAEVLNAIGQAETLLVCEHASNFIPANLDDLGLSGKDLTSHAAWDPGALAVAQEMARLMGAPLVASKISRLVYDCNRPPSAPDAMPARSEVIEVPGNANLSAAERQSRVDTFYVPFRNLLTKTMDDRKPSALVTVHSFTPVYKGQQRSVEIGLLHDEDTRLADAMLACAAEHSQHNVQTNAPYGPQDGVTHTLKEHALQRGIFNVMIEVRNDLIRTETEQQAMADLLSGWLTAALTSLAVTQCKG